MSTRLNKETIIKVISITNIKTNRHRAWKQNAPKCLVLNFG